MTADLHAVVDAYLTHKRGVGRKFDSEQAELTLLARFADQRGVNRLDQLSAGVIDDFLASRPRTRPRSFNHLLGVVTGLLNWAVRQEMLDVAPAPLTRKRRGTADRLPFLFDRAQARRLLDTAAALPDNPRALHRGPTYRTVYAICYGLGLRAGEACGLRVADVDVDRGLLVVRGGKFGKTRLVPHGPQVGELLHRQLEYRHQEDRSAGTDGPLFTFDGRRCMHPGTASQTFHHLVPLLDLPVPDGVGPPRLHSLRHSFAVGCLLRWYRQGIDPMTRLHQLSTFMGHVDPKSTAVYLQITPVPSTSPRPHQPNPAKPTSPESRWRAGCVEVRQRPVGVMDCGHAQEPWPPQGRQEPTRAPFTPDAAPPRGCIAA